jgi:hypothetical protein
MIVGFNHNISYCGTVFHVQTEDSGLKNPQIVTLLYQGGVIISSKKTLYADIIKVDNLDQVVEELAKEQHKAMLKRLTAGDFDERIIALGISLDNSKKKSTDKGTDVEHGEQDTPEIEPKAPVESSEVSEDEQMSEKAIIEESRADKLLKTPPESMSIDDLVFAYLTAGRNS